MKHLSIISILNWAILGNLLVDMQNSYLGTFLIDNTLLMICH